MVVVCAKVEFLFFLNFFLSCANAKFSVRMCMHSMSVSISMECEIHLCAYDNVKELTLRTHLCIYKCFFISCVLMGFFLFFRFFFVRACICLWVEYL